MIIDTKTSKEIIAEIEDYLQKNFPGLTEGDTAEKVIHLLGLLKNINEPTILDRVKSFLKSATHVVEEVIKDKVEEATPEVVKPVVEAVAATVEAATDKVEDTATTFIAEKVETLEDEMVLLIDKAITDLGFDRQEGSSLVDEVKALLDKLLNTDKLYEEVR